MEELNNFLTDLNSNNSSVMDKFKKSNGRRIIDGIHSYFNNKKLDDLAEREQALVEREQALTEREQALVEREQALAESEQALAESEQALAESEQSLVERKQALVERKEKLDICIEVSEIFKSAEKTTEGIFH